MNNSSANDPWKNFKNEVDQVEKRFKNVFTIIGSQLRTLDKVRTKSQSVLVEAKEYAEVETAGVKSALLGFIECEKEIDVQRQKLHDRIDIKVFEKLGLYATLCKRAKELIQRRDQSAANKEKRKSEWEKVQRSMKSTESQKQTAFKMLEAATKDLKKADKDLLEHIQEFEREKVRDVKAVFMELAHAELTYHSRCLEQMTRVYNLFDRIDEEKELQAVLDRFRPPSDQLAQSLNSNDGYGGGSDMLASGSSFAEGDMVNSNFGMNSLSSTSSSRPSSALQPPTSTLRQPSNSSFGSMGSQTQDNPLLSGRSSNQVKNGISSSGRDKRVAEVEEEGEGVPPSPQGTPYKPNKAAIAAAQRITAPKGRQQEEEEFKVSSLDEGSEEGDDAGTPVVNKKQSERRPASSSSQSKKQTKISKAKDEEEWETEESEDDLQEEASPPPKRAASSTSKGAGGGKGKTQSQTQVTEVEDWEYSD